MFAPAGQVNAYSDTMAVRPSTCCQCCTSLLNPWSYVTDDHDAHWIRKCIAVLAERDTASCSNTAAAINSLAAGQGESKLCFHKESEPAKGMSQQKLLAWKQPR